MPLAVLLVFVVAELLMFPVLVLVFACGLAFGPWLGTAYALLGSMASSLIPYLAGRKLGRKRLERWGGAPVRKLDRLLESRGVIAVFLLRKVPAPFSLANMLCGASGITFRDFLLGTFLGMSTGVVLITVIGGQFAEVMRDPSPLRIATGVVLLLLPITLALLVQRHINARMERQQ